MLLIPIGNYVKKYIFLKQCRFRNNELDKKIT